MLALIPALLGFFLIILDASAVNVGLPAITSDLNGGIAGLQWVVDGYALTFAAFTLSAGAFADRIGASRAYVLGLAAFALTSLACGLAPTLPALIAARVGQGVAAALMLPASLALVRQAYADPVRRARAIAVWTAGGAVAVAAGPVAGGLLTSMWSWRGVFLVNLPACLLALGLLVRVQTSPRRYAGLDLPGQVAAVLALAGLTYTVIEGGHAGFGTPRVWAALAVTVLAAGAFVVRERLARQPMLPFDLFRTREVRVVIATGFAINAAFYGIVFVLSLYLQQVRHESALQAGLVFVPMAVCITVSNLISPRVAGRFGPRAVMVVGHVLICAGLFGLLAIHAGTPTPAIAALLLPVGLGGALMVPTLTAVLLGAVPAERAGLAAGVFNAVRQVGGALAVALFGTLVARPAGFLPGLAACLLIGAGLLLGTAVAATVALRQDQVGG
ncbi:MFS transporter [Flindersiella endophytica]